MESRDFPLCSSVKQALLNGIFNCRFNIQDFRADSAIGESYFEHYQKVVEDCSAYSTTATHHRIINLVHLLKQPDATPHFIESILREQLIGDELENCDEVLADSINLAV